MYFVIVVCLDGCVELLWFVVDSVVGVILFDSWIVCCYGLEDVGNLIIGQICGVFVSSVMVNCMWQVDWVIGSMMLKIVGMYLDLLCLFVLEKVVIVDGIFGNDFMWCWDICWDFVVKELQLWMVGQFVGGFYCQINVMLE